MFKIAMLPAQQGDAVWIEYGDARAPHRVLIDGGTPPTWDVVRARIDALEESDRGFELLVVTHVDTDHIGGILRLLSNLPHGLKFDDVWFNGFDQLPSTRLGTIDGELLTTALNEIRWPWNKAFDGHAVMMAPQPGGIPTRELPGGLRLSVLSPGADELARLARNWQKVLKDAGLDPDNPDRAARLLELAIAKGLSPSVLGEVPPDVEQLAESKSAADTSVANGSCIALLAEYEGKSCLLSGDAFPAVVLSGIRQLVSDAGKPRFKVDALKVPHHGSQHNVSNDLLDTIETSTYAFSTNGAIFGHPDDAAIARIVWANRFSGCQLRFNYSKDHAIGRGKKAAQIAGPAAEQGTAAAANQSLNPDWSVRKWDDPDLASLYRYDLSFGDDTGATLTLAE